MQGRIRDSHIALSSPVALQHIWATKSMRSYIVELSMRFASGSIVVLNSTISECSVGFEIPGVLSAHLLYSNTLKVAGKDLHEAVALLELVLHKLG